MHQRSNIAARRWVGGFLLSLWLSSMALGSLAGRIGKAVQSQEGGDYAIQVIKPSSGATVCSYSAKKPLIPASNMKLVTTAAAWKYLGRDFEYKTVVGLCGDTLVVIGSGDPLLGDKATDTKLGRQSGWIFEKISQALRERGIQEVNDIVIDTTIFDNQRVHPSWPANDYNKWYACEVCGLNYNDNCIEVTATNVGGAVAIEIDPATKFVQFTNEVRAISSGEGAVGANRSPQPNRITIFGRCKTRDGPFKVAIEQPAAFFGVLLAEHLGRSGIAVRGKVIERGVAENCKLSRLVEFSTPIANVLERANTDSLGLAAEALLKTIDAHNNTNHKNGSWAGGRESVRRYLSGLGIAPEEFKLDDGSGLSRENRLSTNAITTVLLNLYKSENWEQFRASLAVGGEGGTIDRYFSQPKYRGKIFGKTGYISGVRALSGVCLTRDGPYIFSVLSNGPKGLSRDAINDIAKAIIDEYSAN